MAATIFAIDTAGERCCLALCRGADVQTLLGEVGRTHLEQVMPMIDQLFARCGLRPQQCDAFAFGCGPGSFTGLRVACTIVQGLALGTGKPVIPIGNLQLLAATADTAQDHAPPMGGPERAFVATDARMEQAYWCVFEKQDGVWTQLSPPSLCDATELPQMIADWKPDWCAGNAAWLHRHVGDGAAPVRQAAVQGEILARLAQEQFARGQVVPPERALPAYVRDRVALTVTERRTGATGAQS